MANSNPKTLDNILSIIGIEPNSEYDTNYTNVKKMFVEWGLGIVGENQTETYEKAHFDNGIYLKTHTNLKVKYQNQLREEQRSCIDKEGKV